MTEESKWTAGAIGTIFLLIAVVIGAFMFGLPLYGIWSAEQSGRAELANAEYSKRVAVETALAKRDSAKLEGEAEALRAEGLATANVILGDSLKGKEEYLRYLWITQIQQGETKEVIYVPTEAGIPILEAGKRP